MNTSKYFLGIFLFLASCKGNEPTAAKTVPGSDGNIVELTDAQLRSTGLVTGKIERKEIATILKLNGVIDVPPQNLVSISIPLGGYLQSSKLLPGMHVNKGEVIAVVEGQQYIQLQQDYLAAKANQAFLEAEYNRQKDLQSSMASSEKVYQQAEADYRSHKVLITALSEKLKLAGINPAEISEDNILRRVSVFSPITGYVSAVNVNIGRYVSPTDILFELVSPTDVHLALKVFEKDLDKLSIGQPLMAFTNNLPDKKYPCEILLIGRNLSADRSTTVHCHFQKPDKSLVPGTYMNAEVEIRKKNAYVLPEEAVVRFDNKNYVFVKTGSKRFQLTVVETGITENGMTELPDPGQLVSSELVLKGAYALLMSLKNRSEE